MLSTSYTLPCGTVVPGRIVKAAMTEGLADDWGYPTEELCRLYKLWSTNHNAGHMLLTGNIQIDRRYVERPGNVAIEPECPDPQLRLSKLKEFAAAAQQDGTLCFAQLSHGGRQSNVLVSLEALAPSSIKSESLMPLPDAKEMTLEEIEDVVQRFANAALVCKQAGFAGVQLHAAHGYLLSSFLSPRANKRTDKYGGDLSGRSLLLFEVLQACRKAVGNDYPLSVKLNSSDFQKGGFSEDDAMKIALQLEQVGLDLLEVSGGSYENPSMMLGPTGFAELQSVGKLGNATSTQLREGYFLVFAEKMKASLNRLPLLVTGGFRSRHVMESALKSGACQFVGIGRPVCGMPDAVSKLLHGEIDELPKYETLLQLPWYVRWLNYVILGHLIKAGAFQMWTYRNLYRMGHGEKFTNEKDANMLADLLFMEKWHFAKAAKTRGLPNTVVGAALNAPKPLMPTYAKIALVVAVAVAAMSYSKL
ncbi:hypothetical protein BASA81_004157 [Batrachochytrium salamandrivorans]|nr:hypothetical protein BASA81_004157 [Batrachochytrium salamandrivorans]